MEKKLTIQDHPTSLLVSALSSETERIVIFNPSLIPKQSEIPEVVVNKVSEALFNEVDHDKLLSKIIIELAKMRLPYMEKNRKPTIQIT